MQYYNNNHNSEDYFIIKAGRKATTSGLIAMLIALSISIFNAWPPIASIFFVLFGIYVGITGFWGAHQSNIWFRKFKYKMNDLLWKILKIPVILAGAILGLLVWGLVEHLLLVIAMEDTVSKNHFSSFLIAIAILIPVLGPWIEKKINYSTKIKN
ncbi:MAG: hypothetical protein ACQEQF_03540 [Bacillota bacterium]